MIRRRDNPTIIITQTAHGWLAGQFAAHWGNDRFRLPVDRHELMLTASNHDQGWWQWEQNPKINERQRPTDFLEMPVDEHLAIWRRSIACVESQTRYGAVLVSQHARFLNEKRVAAQRDPQPEWQKLVAFCEDQRAWETAQLAELRQIAVYQQACQPAPLAAAMRLLQIFDWLSLLLCMDDITESVVADVPAQLPDERVSITLKPLADGALNISPWPFAEPEFSATVQTRRLSATTFASDADLQAEWHTAPKDLRVFTFRAEREEK